MPLGERRLARTKRLIKVYLQYHRALGRRRIRLAAQLRQQLAHARLEHVPRHYYSPSLPLLAPFHAPTLEAADHENDFTSDTGSSSSESLLTTSSDFDTSSESSMNLPPGEDVDAGAAGYDSENGWDADDEDSELDEDCGDEVRRGSLGIWVLKEIEDMYAHRYEMPRDHLPKGPAFLRHVLTVWKDLRPDHFRQELRVSPATFDKILHKISNHPIFFNNSNNPQMSVEDQLAITLYRLGHDGNAASLQSIANWAGVGKGTVTLCTQRVMVSVLHPDFMHEAVRFPTKAEKDEAKAWVSAHSCRAWHHGWCLVDGTLVPLAEQPHWFGESYFDRKCNYSLNIQVCHPVV